MPEAGQFVLKEKKGYPMYHCPTGPVCVSDLAAWAIAGLPAARTDQIDQVNSDHHDSPGPSNKNSAAVWEL